MYGPRQVMGSAARNQFFLLFTRTEFYTVFSGDQSVGDRPEDWGD
jgi:hypothetical protein